MDIGAVGSGASQPAKTTQAQAPATAPGGFAGDLATALSGVGGNNSTLGAYLLGGTATQQGGYGLQEAIAGGQMGEAVTQGQLTNQEAQSAAQYQEGGELLSYLGTGLQSQGLAAQASTAAKQQGTEEAQYGVQQTQYPEQQAEAALANQNAVINQRDQAAIGGTLQTTANQRAVGTQAAQYGWQQADIFRNQQLAQLQQQSEQQGYQGSQEQIANQQAQLGLQAQQAGLSRDQAEAQLKFGLQQTGVSTAQDLYGYLSQAAAAEGGAAQAYQGATSQAALIGGLPAGFMGQGG